MAVTHTGSFGVGFRRTGFCKDLAAAARWAVANDFACLDVGASLAEIETLVAAGCAVGSVDLLDWKGPIQADAAKVKEAVAAQSEFIRAAARLGARHFFVVMLPSDPAAKRADNFKLMVDGYSQLIPVLEETGTDIVVEGWPGPGALACTPEGYRALLTAIPSPAMAINFDPSHLVRMHIDPVRFLGEFAPRVRHVHGKDTEYLADLAYELGTEQPPTFHQGRGWGGTYWRYCIPGHGNVRWTKCFDLLAQAGYQGKVCIELEDANFNGTEEGEKLGLTVARDFLKSC